ncbi:sugar transferase [Nocardioides sp. HB32]
MIGDRLLKILDLVVAAAALVVTAPLVVMAALGIKLTSHGPVLYRTTRAGVGGTPFSMLKLRTMHVGREDSGRVTSGSDARVFPFGRLLRRFKLDELPQLVNVLHGQMALVGPRPEDLSIVRGHYTAQMWKTLSVPPGVTSVGSLHYYAMESSLPGDPAEAERVYLEELLARKAALDLVYIENRSLGYALQVLVRTAFGILGRHQVFVRKMAWEQETADAYLRSQRP